MQAVHLTLEAAVADATAVAATEHFGAVPGAGCHVTVQGFGCGVAVSALIGLDSTPTAPRTAPIFPRLGTWVAWHCGVGADTSAGSPVALTYALR